MYEVIIHDGASLELSEAAVFYEGREEGLGELFLAEVQRGFPL